MQNHTSCSIQKSSPFKVHFGTLILIPCVGSAWLKHSSWGKECFFSEITSRLLITQSLKNQTKSLILLMLAKMDSFIWLLSSLMFLMKKALITMDDKGMTSLHHTCTFGQIEVVKCFLNKQTYRILPI